MVGEPAPVGEKGRTDTVDLSPGGHAGGATDGPLTVEISDALSEKDKVKFTIQTKTSLKEFAKPECTVTRDHEEFVWLHDAIEENEDYAGFIIPPTPPRPDFETSREKLQRLSEGENTMTREEFTKMKAELEAEYLATFKKTVSEHEVFLGRLARHSTFQNDSNFRIFLEYESELSVRGKNKKEKVSGWLKWMTQSVDEVLLSGQKDVDDFFENEKNYLIEYNNHVKECTIKSEKLVKLQASLAETMIKTANSLNKLATMEQDDEAMSKYLQKVSECLEKARKMESRVASDTELKESNTLRYYLRETQAAKDLLYRRLRCLANYEAANKGLERARAKNKDVHKAESDQQFACETFEKITEVARSELKDLKLRRVAQFKKNLVELGELQLKHAKAYSHLLKTTIDSL